MRRSPFDKKTFVLGAEVESISEDARALLEISAFLENDVRYGNGIFEEGVTRDIKSHKHRLDERRSEET